jgi:threonine dehydrogenase-like Zn-dependent dehydrogenase
LLIALDVNLKRLKVAQACGADLVMNPREQDVAAEILKLTEGYGCDVYIEATGRPEGVQQGLDLLCKRGTFVEFSVMGEPATIDWSIIGDHKELNIHGSSLSPYTYPVAIDMIAKKRLPLDQIITHELPLSDFQQAIDLVASGEQSIKVILKP